MSLLLGLVLLALVLGDERAPRLGLDRARRLPDDVELAVLLHLADEAMYLVKNTNRDSVAAANIGILKDTTAAAAETAG